jgi:hypothetical protein
MGQYWIPVNLDKREFVSPHKLGCGLKLAEQVGAEPGTGSALVILTAAMPQRRGGGDLDLNETDPKVARRTIGRWAGDRIAIVGDYAEDSDLAAEHRASRIYGLCPMYEDEIRPADRDSGALFTDVSSDVARVIEHELGGVFSGNGWRDWRSSQTALWDAAYRLKSALAGVAPIPECFTPMSDEVRGAPLTAMVEALRAFRNATEK